MLLCLSSFRRRRSPEKRRAPPPSTVKLQQRAFDTKRSLISRVSRLFSPSKFSPARCWSDGRHAGRRPEGRCPGRRHGTSPVLICFFLSRTRMPAGREFFKSSPESHRGEFQSMRCWILVWWMLMIDTRGWRRDQERAQGRTRETLEQIGQLFLLTHSCRGCGVAFFRSFRRYALARHWN